jgi:antitoxin FitA
MATLQVRELPATVYEQLKYCAQQDHRSIAQETIVLLQESIDRRLSGKSRRAAALAGFKGLSDDTRRYSDPVESIRKDRESR